MEEKSCLGNGSRCSSEAMHAIIHVDQSRKNLEQTVKAVNARIYK